MCGYPCILSVKLSDSHCSFQMNKSISHNEQSRRWIGTAPGCFQVPYHRLTPLPLALSSSPPPSSDFFFLRLGFVSSGLARVAAFFLFLPATFLGIGFLLMVGVIDSGDPCEPPKQRLLNSFFYLAERRRAFRRREFFLTSDRASLRVSARPRTPLPNRRARASDILATAERER